MLDWLLTLTCLHQEHSPTHIEPEGLQNCIEMKTSSDKVDYPLSALVTALSNTAENPRASSREDLQHPKLASSSLLSFFKLQVHRF